MLSCADIFLYLIFLILISVRFNTVFGCCFTDVISKLKKSTSHFSLSSLAFFLSSLRLNDLYFCQAVFAGENDGKFAVGGAKEVVEGQGAAGFDAGADEGVAGFKADVLARCADKSAVAEAQDFAQAVGPPAEAQAGACLQCAGFDGAIFHIFCPGYFAQRCVDGSGHSLPRALPPDKGLPAVVAEPLAEYVQGILVHGIVAAGGVFPEAFEGGAGQVEAEVGLYGSGKAHELRVHGGNEAGFGTDLGPEQGYFGGIDFNSHGRVDRCEQ